MTPVVPLSLTYSTVACSFALHCDPRVHARSPPATPPTVSYCEIVAPPLSGALEKTFVQGVRGYDLGGNADTATITAAVIGNL